MIYSFLIERIVFRRVYDVRDIQTRNIRNKGISLFCN